MSVERKLRRKTPILVYSAIHKNGILMTEFSPNGQSTQQQKAMADYFANHDPYDHPVVHHNRVKRSVPLNITYGLMLGHPTFDGASLQLQNSDIHDVTLDWLNQSAAAGRQWIVAVDD